LAFWPQYRPKPPGRYKTDKPVIYTKKRDKTKKRASPEKQRKTKTKQRPRARGAAAEPTKSMDLWTRMLNYFTEVCVESSIFFILKPQELSKPAPKPQPPGDSLSGWWLKRPGGSIEIRGAGGERATGTCFCVARAALFFACVRPPFKKNKENVLYRPENHPNPLTQHVGENFWYKN
jgi:hypothetical protein